MKIPLSKPYIDQEIKDRVMEVIDSGQYILGDQCGKFEEEFAHFIGARHAVLTSSGTSAIFLCLKALGVKEKDAILVPSLTAFPTIEPIFHVGARPIFIDIDRTLTIDPQHVENMLKHCDYLNIKGIIPVHLYGHPVDMDPILDLAKRYGLFVLEDCCQAHGAKYKGARVGSMGTAGCFSFYPSKNMTVLGDGGMIVTSNDHIARTCRMLRDHGREKKYEHELVGYNMRFNEIQAAVGRIQLRKLDKFNESRRQIARWYDEKLWGVVPTLQPKEWAESVYHLYVIKTMWRDGLVKFLKNNGIQTGIHYPIPNHMQPAVEKIFGPNSLSVTEIIARRILSLPMYPELKENEVDFICTKIKEFFKELP